MSEEQNLYGIDNLKPTARIIGSAITSVANLDANKDGNISGGEIVTSVWQLSSKVLGNRPDLKALKNEGLDLNEAEKAELVEIVAQETVMPRKKVEVLVERGVAIVLDLVDFIIDAQKPEEAFA